MNLYEFLLSLEFWQWIGVLCLASIMGIVVVGIAEAVGGARLFTFEKKEEYHTYYGKDKETSDER